MVLYIMKKAFAKLAEKPFLLWGLSLICGLLIYVAPWFFALLPFLYIPVLFVIEYGQAMIYLNAVNEKEYSCEYRKCECTF